MTDRKYLKRMRALQAVLKSACLERPINDVIIDKILAQCGSLTACWYSSRRRRPWLMILFLAVLSMSLGLFVVYVLTINFERGAP